ncbi:MAG: hypothetical protein JNL32_15655, partial [Candidatus Kapabacteria bacterium]|nr:hypothetical protein [Candidatus Kapabacteria bacterium]
QGTLRLWSVALSGTQNNRTVKYELLSSTVISQGNSADLQITFESFHIPKEGIRCIKLEQTMYDLSSDSIKKRYVYKRGVGSRHDYSLHDKTKPGWLFVTEINGVIHLPITGGNPLEWNEPFGRIPFSVELPNENEPLYLENLSNAGDLNNDGIGELATVYVSGSHRLFRIYAGTPHSTDVVNHDLSQYKIDVRNPLSPNESYIINVHSLREMPGTLQLYSLRGELVRTIWEGMLLNEVTPIVFSSLGLPRGVYNLRLQAGATVLDKPIIIE